MKLVYSDLSKKQIQKLPPLIKKGIREILEFLKISPYLGKPLQRELLGFRSMRYKRYRIIYRIEENASLLIYTVEHRKSVYEELKSSLRKL